MGAVRSELWYACSLTAGAEVSSKSMLSCCSNLRMTNLALYLCLLLPASSLVLTHTWNIWVCHRPQHLSSSSPAPDHFRPRPGTRLLKSPPASRYSNSLYLQNPPALPRRSIGRPPNSRSLSRTQEIASHALAHSCPTYSSIRYSRHAFCVAAYRLPSKPFPLVSKCGPGSAR